MRSLNTKNLTIAVIISILIAVSLFVISFTIGKQEFFLRLNTDLGSSGDDFFAVATYGGDGLMWIPVVFITWFIIKRRDCFSLLITAFLLCTILTQVCKYFIVPHEPRPTKAILNTSLIHTVPNVELAKVSSFPSGHTATAFCFYFLFCLLLNKKWWLYNGLVYALLVGYSRIYLAQHFPLDVAGGIIVGVITVYLSLVIQKYLWKRSAS